jgi:hypothetical protein
VNQALTPISVRDPVLAARRTAERVYLDEVASLARTVALVPWVPEPPRGSRALAALVSRPDRAGGVGSLPESRAR